MSSIGISHISYNGMGSGISNLFRIINSNITQWIIVHKILLYKTFNRNKIMNNNFLLRHILLYVKALKTLQKVHFCSCITF